jgi:protein phosphatase
VNTVRYDVIGDIHGCFEECRELLIRLGYQWDGHWPVHPEGRVPVFIGDLTDRGPNSVKVIQLVTAMVFNRLALYVPGNHCDKLYRYMNGSNVQIKHGLETTVKELQELDAKERARVIHDFKKLYQEAPLYLTLDDGHLLVAHAGIKEAYIGKHNKKVKTFVLYGDISGETDETGFPIRRDWAKHYHGAAWVVYGHTPVSEPRVVGRTINIDTGCVFGGQLTAFRWPEKETVSVPSRQPYIAEKFRHFDD